MIVYKNKTFVQMDGIDHDWIGNADWVIKDGSELANKIIMNYPYFDFVLNDKGEIIDILPVEPESYEPTMEDYILDMDFRLSCLELGL